MKVIYCFKRLDTVLDSTNLIKPWKIFFSVSVSVSFCRFLCSKGHSIRAYLDAI